MTIKEKLQSRKFWLTVAAFAKTAFEGDPKWGALVVGVYVIVEGYLDGTRAV